MLDEGADVEGGDWRLYSPLYIAVDYGHESILQLLLQHGAKVDAAISVESMVCMLASQNTEG